MAGRYKDLTKELKPGPAEYLPGEKSLVGPKYGFGKGSRSIDKRDNGPGPGHYRVPVKIASH